jgi:protein O-mannosyl-transferase
MQSLVDKSQFSPDTYGEQYQDKLNKFTQKSELLCEYAIFLYFIRENYDNAEYYYKKALPLGPKNVNHLGYYAAFLNSYEKDYNRGGRID